MKTMTTVNILAWCIAVAAIVATLTGILSGRDYGQQTHVSVHGQRVELYGKGVYRHMSTDVAPQGIAQDYVTLFIGVPLLLIGMFGWKKGSLRARFVLTGTLAYFFVTYLFYMAMAAYNQLFLVYVVLTGASFFALTICLLSFDLKTISVWFRGATPVRFAGAFLIFNAVCIALLWLSIIVPPLLDGTLYPPAVEHYTTLIVQGMDLSLLLPMAVVVGVLLFRRMPMGYLLGPVYFVFLSVLMLALLAKLVGMGMLGQNIIPAVFIIPVFATMSIVCSVLLLINIYDNQRIPHDLRSFSIRYERLHREGMPKDE